MRCLVCGKEIDDDSKFCDRCGSPVKILSQDNEKPTATEKQDDTNTLFPLETRPQIQSRRLHIKNYRFFLIGIAILICIIFQWGASEYAEQQVQQAEQERAQAMLEEAQIAYERAKSNFTVGSYENAMLLIEEAIEKNPNHAEAIELRKQIVEPLVSQLIERTKALQIQGELQEAKTKLVKALHYDPNNIAALNIMQSLTEEIQLAEAQQAEAARLEEERRAQEQTAAQEEARKKEQQEALFKKQHVQQDTLYICEEAGCDPIYYPTITLHSDGTFTMNCNMLDSMEEINGTYDFSDDIINFQLDEMWVDWLFGLKSFYAVRSGEDSFKIGLANGKEEINGRLGITSTNAIFRIAKQESKKVASDGVTAFQYDTTIGYLTDSNGYRYEYFSESPALLCEELQGFTGAQLQAFYDIYEGQGIYFSGEITGVSADGRITLNCLDEAATKLKRRMWPIMAMVELYTNVDNDTLLALKKGQTVSCYGVISQGCYSKMLGVPTLVLTDGLLVGK